MNKQRLTKGFFLTAELLLIIAFSIIPLLIEYNYRINIFLSWEGAYRLYLGQIPYRDFGLPLGFGYWLLPAAFFFIFGPFMTTLIKTQVFINIVSGIIFRGILNTLGIQPQVRFIAVLTFCLSYILLNIWPWYNHSVIFFQLAGLYFLLRHMLQRPSFLNLAAAAFFLFLSFFTKQDAGAMGLLIALALLLYHSIANKQIGSLFFFSLFYIGFACLFILPFYESGFTYWFNYGQAPHHSRVALPDFVAEFLTGSKWEKFYLLVTLLILVNKLIEAPKWTEVLSDQRFMVFVLLTMGILTEALLFQVTSYVPPDNHIFFHSFAVAFAFSYLNIGTYINRLIPFTIIALMTVLFWGNYYWRHINNRLLPLISPPKTAVVTGENIISRNTYILPDPVEDSLAKAAAEWVPIKGYRAFEKMKMHPTTAAGINRLMQLPIVREKNKKLRVLNMTELTPLAYEMPYEPERNVPLWHHLGVGMFNKQVDEFCRKIQQQHYDIALFEAIPKLNNFYPWEVQRCLRQHYVRIDSFPGPRQSQVSYIEVYVRPSAKPEVPNE
ncbi:hypothetical protein [Rhodoflexus sp.]